VLELKELVSLYFLGKGMFVDFSSSVEIERTSLHTDKLRLEGATRESI